MNMISTGAFLNEMDASNKQPTVAEKFAAVWEKKNAKAARAGGVSLMALSLAACGGSSSTTTTTSTDTSTTTPAAPTGGNFDLTPLDDVASTTTAVNGSIASTFRFTSADDTVNAVGATIQANDTLLDGSTTDSDTINITSTAAMNAMTAVNIENANVTMASGTPTATFTNFTGLKAVSVDGTVAGTITNAGTAETTLNGYTRVLTIDDTTGLGGTAAAGTAETINVTLSGATYGSTAATRSGVTLTAANTGANETLETLNLTSSGSAANDFALDASDTDVVLKTVNLLGTQDLTVRVSHADITAKTVVGTNNTGETSVMIDRNGATTTDTNVAGFTGIDNIIAKDGTSPGTGGDGADMIGLSSGQKITLADDFNTSVFTITPATYTSMADSLTIALDNETATTNTDVNKIDVQNVKALNLISNGHGASVSTSATTINLIDDLTGDAATITITGDTALNLDANIDATQTASGTDSARAVTVTAAGMTGTAFLDFAAATNAKVSYTVTGSDNADTIVANDSGSTLNGGAGKDAITGGLGADTINGGAGDDTITATYGADKITGGEGKDTVDVNALSATAVVEVNTVVLTAVDNAADDFVITIDGTSYTQVASGTIDTDGAAFITNKAADIYANHGIVATYTSGSDTLTLTGKADGTDFTTTAQHNNGGTYAALTVGDSTSAAKAKDMALTFTDFEAGDVIDVDGVVTSATTVYHEGAAADVAATDTVIVLTGASYANVAAAEDAYNATAGNIDGVVAFLNSTTGTAQVFYDGDLDTDGNLADTAVFVTLENITTLADLGSAFTADTIVM